MKINLSMMKMNNQRAYYLGLTLILFLIRMDLSIAYINLSMNLTRDDISTYINHPIQGECKSQVPENSEMRLLFSTSTFWPGFMTMMGEYYILDQVRTVHEMTHAYVKKTQESFEKSSALTTRVVVFKICAQELARAGYNFLHIYCNVMSRYSQGTRTSKVIKIQYAPGKPFLKVHFHDPPSIAFVGRTLRVSCLAPIGSTTASLLFMLMDSSYKQLFWKVSWNGESDYTPPGHNKADSVKIPSVMMMFLTSLFVIMVYKKYVDPLRKSNSLLSFEERDN
ncbi:hypothetical protein EGW08_021211 [Elysia chlorotica]|uniref:Uncharacterized protein n=1 Tax=Elysia chlorotica TaxID=188477 RepID=A0A3S0ZMQ8_ELYCH|nr:hypothetical protein EGW08_021211 [Elysia chlorotica]